MTAMSEYDFGRKYSGAGPIRSRIIDNFYAGIQQITDQIATRLDTAHEVGCGEGYSTERLRRILPARVRLTASDVDPKLVEAAGRRNPGVEIACESVYDLPQQDGAFDLVYCMEVLEHLERPDVALRQLRRISSRYLILSVPREPLWRVLNLVRGAHLARAGNTPGHIQHWSRSRFVLWASRYGLVRAVRSPTPWTQVLLEIRRPAPD